MIYDLNGMDGRRIKVHDKVFRPYMSQKQVEDAIQSVADRLNKDFSGTDEIPMFLCVLNGAIMFTAELMKRTEFSAELVSIKMSSYTGTKSTGTVLNVMGLTSPVEGRTVLICEDVVDTGNTIVALKELLVSKGAKDVRICTMLLKPDVYDKDEKIDYVGKEIPNDFIVGYGLDYNELGRNLKEIYVIEQ